MKIPRLLSTCARSSRPGNLKSCSMATTTTSRTAGRSLPKADDLHRRVLEGRRYLEDLLGTKIRVFVPPHNAIGRHGLRADRTGWPSPRRGGGRSRRMAGSVARGHGRCGGSFAGGERVEDWGCRGSSIWETTGRSLETP